MLRPFLLSLCTLLLATAHAAVETTLDGPTLTAEQREILAQVEACEAHLRAFRALPPPEREAKRRSLLKRLENIEQESQGQPWHNKTLYWLAHWHLEFGNPEDGLPYLESIESNQGPSFRFAGRATEARIRLKLGQIDAAEAIASSLTETVPEFAELTNTIALYRTVGQRVPALTGQVLAGGKDPLAQDGPWMLCLWGNLELSDDRYAFEHMLTFLETPELDRVLDLAVIALGSNPLSQLTRYRELHPAGQVPLMWLPPENEDLKAWHIPVTPIRMLLGPGHRVIAIDPRDSEIYALAGVKAPAPVEIQPRSRGRFNWR